MPPRETGRWVVPKQVGDRRPDVFCLPFAGGGASYFRAWSRFEPLRVAIRPVQLPGREERFTERTLDRMADVVAAAIDGLGPSLQPPYALFGHSMGAMISYELVHALAARELPLPKHLFVSAAPAPHRANEIPAIYDLPEPPFFDEVQRYSAFPREVLDSPELLALLEPRLRADLAVTGTYRYGGHAPLAIPITAFGGSHDDVVRPELVEAWREHTTGRFESVILPGGHFYLADHARDVLDRIESALG